MELQIRFPDLSAECDTSLALSLKAPGLREMNLRSEFQGCLFRGTRQGILEVAFWKPQTVVNLCDY